MNIDNFLGGRKIKSKSNFVIMVVIFILSDVAFGGVIVGWGRNDFGQSDVPDGNDFIDISAGGWHGVALKSDGSLVAWGNNEEGQCDVPGGNDYVAVAAGGRHSIALKSDGSVVAWGQNFCGQCDVPDDNDLIKIAAGYEHNLAINSDDLIIEWGCEYAIPGEPNGPNDPNQLAGTFIDIDGGFDFTVALRTDGTITELGSKEYEQGTIPNGNDFIAVSAGSYHSIALKNDGSLVAWGNNSWGQCDVPDDNDFIAVDGILALRADGALAAWGCNNNGECDVPVGNGFVGISAGLQFSLALTSEETRKLTVNTEPMGINTIVPAAGEHSCYLSQRVYINAEDCPLCPDIFTFDHWEGDVYDPNSPSDYLIMDKDRNITAFYIPKERTCGDECHPILTGDLNKDCYINFDDFALYTDNWLSCTHPDCD